MAVLAGLTVADPPGLWSELGFSVEGERCRVGSVPVRLGGPGRGVISWALAAAAQEDPSEDHIDGLPTTVLEEPDPAPPGEHANGVLRLDHLVVSTPDLERTVAALARQGILERRRRPAGRPGGPPSVQVFFRLGEAILELVGPPSPPEGGDPGPARFWGLAFTVSDLDLTGSVLGERLRPAKAAVQPGRLIASLDRGAGSSVEMAFMTAGS